MLNDIGVDTRQGVRDPLVESMFEYGSRRGVWRVLDIFRNSMCRSAFWPVQRAIEQKNLGYRDKDSFIVRGHEIVSHGYRWID